MLVCEGVSQVNLSVSQCVSVNACDSEHVCVSSILLRAATRASVSVCHSPRVCVSVDACVTRCLLVSVCREGVCR